MRSRRDFLKRASAGAMAAFASRRVAADEASAGCAKPADGAARVGLATIGIGGQGTGDTKAALKVPGVELVAVADVYDGRLTRARELFCEGLVTTRDYRELLARPDVDAVIIATPDHGTRRWRSRRFKPASTSTSRSRWSTRSRRG